MISVLIVDDEYLIRRLVISAVDWEALGFRIAGEAADGIEAIELMESLAPELVILDINIPMIDGIELSYIIAARFPNVKIIILTGYDDFIYIQKSLRAGVLNYVVKPLDKAEFTSVLTDARHVILKNKTKEKYMAHLVSGTLGKNLISSERELLKAIEEQQINSTDFRYRPVVVEAGCTFDRCWRNDGEQALWMRAIEQIYLDIVAASSMRAITFVKENTIISCITGEANQRDREVHELFEAVITAIADHTSITATITIGKTAHSEAELPTFLAACQKALEQKFIGGAGKVYYVHSYAPVYPSHQTEIYDTETLLPLLRKHDLVAIKSEIDHIFDMLTQGGFCKDYIFLVSANLIECIIKFSIEVGLETQNIFYNRDIYLERLNKIDLIEDLKVWIKNLYQNVIRFSMDNRKPKPAQLVEEACAIINSEFVNNELSLANIASQMHVNPNYLSTIFKKQMRFSISEYIVKCRMKRAKDILDNDKNVKVGSLFRQIGYSDPFYFSKSFKKSFGISPSDYKSCRIERNIQRGLAMPEQD